MRKLSVTANIHQKGQSDTERRYGVHYGTLFKHLKSVQTHSFNKFGGDEVPIERFLEAVEETPCQPGAILITRNHYAASAWGRNKDSEKAPLNRVIDEDGDKYVHASIPPQWSGASSSKILKINTHVKGEHHLPLLQNVKKCSIDSYTLHSADIRVFLFVAYKDGTNARVEATPRGAQDAKRPSGKTIDLARLKHDDIDTEKTIVFDHQEQTWSLPNKRPYDKDTMFRLTSAPQAVRDDAVNEAASSAPNIQDVCFINRSTRSSARQCPNDVPFMPPINPGLSLAALAFEGAIFDVQTHDNKIQTVRVRMDMCETLPSFSLHDSTNACFRKPRLVPLKGLHPPPYSDLKKARRLVLAKTPRSDLPSGLHWCVDGVLWSDKHHAFALRVVDAYKNGQKTIMVFDTDWRNYFRENNILSRCKSIIVENRETSKHIRLSSSSHNLWNIDGEVEVLEDKDISSSLQTLFFGPEKTDIRQGSTQFLHRRASFEPSKYKMSIAAQMHKIGPETLVALKAYESGPNICVRQDDAIEVDDVVRFRGPYIDRLSDVFAQTRTTCDTSLWKTPLKRRSEYMSHTRAVNRKDLTKKVTFFTTSYVLMDGVKTRVSWPCAAAETTSIPDFSGTVREILDGDGDRVVVSTMENRRRVLENPSRDDNGTSMFDRSSLGKFVVFSNKFSAEINGRTRDVRWPREAPCNNFSGAFIGFGHDVGEGPIDQMILNTNKLMIRSRLDRSIIELDNPEVNVDPFDSEIFIFSMASLSICGISLSDFMSSVTRVTSDVAVIEDRGVVTAEVVEHMGTPRVVVIQHSSEPPFYIRLHRETHTELETSDIFCNIRIHSEAAVTRYIKANDAPLNVTSRKLPKLEQEGEQLIVRARHMKSSETTDLEIEGLSDVEVRERGFDGTKSASVERTGGSDFNDAMAYGLRHEEDALLTLQEWLDTTRASFVVAKNPDLTFTNLETVSATPDGLVLSISPRTSIDNRGHPCIMSDKGWTKGSSSSDNIQPIEPHWFVEEIFESFEPHPRDDLLTQLVSAALTKPGGDIAGSFSLPMFGSDMQPFKDADEWWQDGGVVCGGRRFMCRFAPRRIGSSVFMPSAYVWYENPNVELVTKRTLAVKAFVEAKSHMGGRNIFRLSSGESYHQQVQTQHKVLNVDTCFFTSWSSKQTSIFEIDKFHLTSTGVVLRPTQITKSVVRQRPRASKMQMLSSNYDVVSTTNTIRCTAKQTSAASSVGSGDLAEHDEMHILKRIDDSGHVEPILKTVVPVTTYVPALVVPIQNTTVNVKKDLQEALGKRLLVPLDHCGSFTFCRSDGRRLFNQDMTGFDDIEDRTIVHVSCSYRHPSIKRVVRIENSSKDTKMLGRSAHMVIGDIKFEKDSMSPKAEALRSCKRLLCVVDYAFVDVMHPKFHAYSDQDGVSHVLCEISTSDPKSDDPEVGVIGLGKRWNKCSTLEQALEMNELDRSLCAVHPTAPPPTLAAVDVDVSDGAWPECGKFPTQMIRVGRYNCFAITNPPETMLEKHMSTVRGMDAASYEKWILWWTDLFMILMLQTSSELVTISIDPKVATAGCTKAATEAAIMCGEMISDAEEDFAPIAPALRSAQWMYDAHTIPPGSDTSAVSDEEKEALYDAWIQSNRASQFEAHLSRSSRVPVVVTKKNTQGGVEEEVKYRFEPVSDSLNNEDYKLLRSIFKNKKRPRLEDRRLEDVVVSGLMR